jgi:hypothetical protein
VRRQSSNIYITIFGFSFQGFSFQVGQVSCQVSVPAVIVITENISPSRVTSNKFYNNKRKTINLTISLNMRRSVVFSPFLATIVFVYSGQVFASSDAARFASHFVFAARSAPDHSGMSHKYLASSRWDSDQSSRKGS